MRVRSSARAGDVLYVAGMTGRDESGAVVAGAAAQARRALERMEVVLAEHGLDRGALVRLRVFITAADDWPAIRDVVSEFTGGEWPPSTVVVVAALVDPSMRVEIESEAALA